MWRAIPISSREPSGWLSSVLRLAQLPRTRDEFEEGYTRGPNETRTEKVTFGLTSLERAYT